MFPIDPEFFRKFWDAWKLRDGTQGAQGPVQWRLPSHVILTTRMGAGSDDVIADWAARQLEEWFKQ